MSLPKITWHILEEEDYVQDNEYYLGSFNTNDTISFEVQVWNNRYGQNNVDSINDAMLALYFENIEDTVLLNYCKVSVDNSAFEPLDIEVERGVINIGRLYGGSNNGIANESTKHNYKNIKIEFSNLPYNLKNNLKNMFLDIEIK